MGSVTSAVSLSLLGAPRCFSYKMRTVHTDAQGGREDSVSPLAEGGGLNKPKLGPGPSLPSSSTRGSLGTRSAQPVPASTYPPPMLQPLLLNSHPACPSFQRQPSHPLCKPRTGLAGESLAAAVVAALATASTGPPDAWPAGRVERREAQPSSLSCQLPHSSHSNPLDT